MERKENLATPNSSAAAFDASRLTENAFNTPGPFRGVGYFDEMHRLWSGLPSGTISTTYNTTEPTRDENFTTEMDDNLDFYATEKVAESSKADVLRRNRRTSNFIHFYLKPPLDFFIRHTFDSNFNEENSLNPNNREEPSLSFSKFYSNVSGNIVPIYEIPNDEHFIYDPENGSFIGNSPPAFLKQEVLLDLDGPLSFDEDYHQIDHKDPYDQGFQPYFDYEDSFAISEPEIENRITTLTTEVELSSTLMPENELTFPSHLHDIEYSSLTEIPELQLTASSQFPKTDGSTSTTMKDIDLIFSTQMPDAGRYSMTETPVSDLTSTQFADQYSNTELNQLME